MSRYRDQIATALDALAIRGTAGYAWLGRLRRAVPRALAQELDERERRALLVARVGDELYWSFFCPGRPVPARRSTVPVGADTRLTAALSAANAGHGSWEPGWTLERRQGATAVVASARLRARVPDGDHDAPDTAGPGTAVSVRLPKELPSRSPGFYMAVGDAPGGPGSPAGVVRVYWHVTPAGAPRLVAALTRRLNADGVPFRLKVADHPFRYDRCDAAVLYVPGDRFGALRPELSALATALRAQLRPAIPAFTLPLAAGVGLAEDPADGASFGTRRCGLLADAIVRAHRDGISGREARLEAVAARFAEAGVTVEAPYREPSARGRHVL